MLATATDPSLLKWAQAETKEIQAELNEIDQRIAEIDKQLSTLPVDAPAPPGASNSSAVTNTRDPHIDAHPHDQRHVLEEKRRKLSELGKNGLIDI